MVEDMLQIATAQGSRIEAIVPMRLSQTTTI